MRRGFRRRGAGTFLDLAEHRTHGNSVAILGGDIAEHARGRRRHFDRHLVGFELDQRLVDGDSLTRFLEPFADGRLGDQFSERGDTNLGHGFNSLFVATPTTDDGRQRTERKIFICRPSSVFRYPNASSRNCLSCA